MNDLGQSNLLVWLFQPTLNQYSDIEVDHFQTEKRAKNNFLGKWTLVSTHFSDCGAATKVKVSLCCN